MSTRTMAEVLTMAREAAKELAKRGDDFATEEFKLSFYSGALLAAFRDLDARMAAGEAPPPEWDPKCGVTRPYGHQAPCLLRPNHGGCHRHDVRGVSMAWSS